MFKYVLFLIFPSIIYSQEFTDNSDSESIEENTIHEYVSLNDNKVYDIEIIIFAYQQDLPNYKTYSNKDWFDDSNALELKQKPEDLKFIQDIQDTIETLDETTVDTIQPELLDAKVTEPDYTVSIVDETEEKNVLAWFEHEPEFYKLTPILKRLVQQQNITPLIHKAWRQPDTPFEQPTYVKLNNFPIETLDETLIDGYDAEGNDNYTTNQNRNIPEINSISNYNSFSENNFVEDEYSDAINAESILESYSDFTVSGMVALSQGRFMHFGHSLNLLRQYTDGNNELRTMVFSLTERKQLKPDELHYYDSPWFGSIVKITEYLGEEENENNESND